MPDNTTLNTATGGDLIASDELTTINGAAATAGLKVQRAKVGHGVDGDFKDATSANPLPVAVITSVALTDTQLRATAVPVSGAFFQTTQPVSGTVAVSNMVAQGLTDAQLRLTAVPVSGAFFQATQPVSGSVTQISNGVISTANSSIVALAANAAFTGTAEDVTEFADIRVTVFADQSSAIDGFQMQQSVNGTAWDVVDSYSIAATTGRIFGVGASAKFFRIVYTNGATAQAAFRIQVKYQKAYGKGSSVRPQDGRARDNDMEEVLSYLMGYNGTGFDMLRSTVANGLAVDVTRLPALAAGVAVIGALTANQSVNTAQIAGIATAVGAGVSGAGVQRIVQASDVIQPAVSENRAATLHVTATAAVNTAITATLPAPAAGLFHYITSVQLVKVYSVLGVAAGAGVVITSTNLPGGPAWLTEQAAGAIGTAPLVINYQPTTPLKAAAAALATTFVAPAQLQTIWRWNISYFTAA